MSKCVLFPLAAVFLVLGIFLWSNLLKPSPWLQNILLSSIQTNVLVASIGTADTAAEVGLALSIPKQSTTLFFSTQAEILRFTLSANGSYTLRYLSLQFEVIGLKPIRDWRVYEVREGQIDFSKEVAYGETQNENLLRLRFYSSPSAAYLGKAGEQEFVLLASVLKAERVENPSLSVNFPESLPKGMEWAWLPGKHDETWLSIGESLGASDVSGLPTKTVQKDP